MKEKFIKISKVSFYFRALKTNLIDCSVKAYKKAETSSGLTIRIEADLRGVKAENFVLMLRDASYREKMEGPIKKFKIVENTSKHTDVTYHELSLPFPLTNRDFVQKRLFVSNKQEPELVAKLGLFKWDHAYNAILIQSTERSEYPVKSSPIRGETSMHYTLLQEDPYDKTLLKMKIVICQDLNGSIPSVVMSGAAEKMAKGMLTDLLKSYKKCF